MALEEIQEAREKKVVDRKEEVVGGDYKRE
jgi:hypothetical protein